MIRKLLIKWAIGILEREEDRLLAPLEGKVPKGDDPPSIKLNYWNRLLDALNSDIGKMLLYRVQLLYNKYQLMMLGCEDEKQIAILAAKMQALYEVLRLPKLAYEKSLVYAARVRAQSGEAMEG